MFKARARLSRWIALAGIAVVALVVAGCGSSSSSGAGSSGGKTNSAGVTDLNFWVRAADAPFTEPIVKAFNASHPHIHVKITVFSDDTDAFFPKFAAAESSGNPPDVAAINLIFTPYFAAHGLLENLTPKVKALPFYSSLSKAHLTLATYNGQLFAAPYSAEASVLFYNKTLFKRAGLNPNSPPKTWAQVQADANTITKKDKGDYGFYFPGRCPGCNGFSFLPLVWASGGNILSSSGTPTVSTSAPVTGALSLYRTMWKAGDMPPSAATDNGANWVTAFAGGKVGMEGLGAFAASELLADYKNIDWGIAPIPGDHGGSASYAGGDEIGIPRGSRHPAQAWQFIQWVLSTHTQSEFLAKKGIVSVRTDLPLSAYPDKRYAVLVHAMKTGRTPYTELYDQLIQNNGGPFDDMIQSGVFGSSSVSSAISTAQHAMEQVKSSQGQ